ncbi:MAG: DNA-binding protein [Candidatus Diapherotrites archaeon]|nr:DNA-binding protein [Candidatus Diapherotrites archaeon]
MDENLDSLRQQRMQHLKKNAEDKKSQQEQAMQAQMQVNALMIQYLEPAAKERLNNVKLINSELYGKVVQTVLYLVKSQKLNRKITDIELKKLLTLATGQKREIKIVRK